MTAVSLMKEYDTYDEFCQAMPEIHMALTATDTLFAQPVRVDRSTMRGRVSELLEAAKATLDELNLKLQVTNCAGDEAAQQRILAQITDAATGKLCRNTVTVKLYTGHAGDASLLRLITKMGFCTRKWGPDKQQFEKCKVCTDKLGTQEHFLLECPRIRQEAAAVFKRIANLLRNGL